MMETLLRFCARQAYGWPQGAHAAFQAVGIDALSLRLVLKENEVSFFASKLLLCSPLWFVLALSLTPMENEVLVHRLS